jgi:hypothetical protein
VFWELNKAKTEGKWAADLVPANQQAGNSYIFGLKE